MPVLQDGQFQLSTQANYVTFGGTNDYIKILNADLADAELQTFDADYPLSHGGLMGRDLMRPMTWTFDLLIAPPLPDIPDFPGIPTYPLPNGTYPILTGGRESSAWDAYRKLVRLWRDRLDRPMGAMWLYFRAGNRNLKVRGRPRRITNAKPDQFAKQGAIYVTAEFYIDDPRIYQDLNRSFTYGESYFSTTDYQTVEDEVRAVNPNYWPVYPGGSQTINWGMDLENYVDVGMFAPTPFKLTIEGRLHYPTILINDHFMTINETLDYGQTLVWDTINKRLTIDGVNVFQSSEGQSRMDAELYPGSNRILIAGRSAAGNRPTATLAYSPADWSV